MNRRWVDVSMPLEPGMTAWPGDPAFALTPLRRVTAGDSCNTSLVSLGTHTGTHIDAPWHFEENGPRLDEIDPTLFFGAARLLDLSDGPVIAESMLGPDPLPPRVLFKTRNSSFPVNGPFCKDYVALEADAARRLVRDGVRLVGVDYLSVAPYKQPGQETHHILLGHGVLVVEGLVLRALEAGVYSFVVLPLGLAGADGAPCRAFVGTQECDL